MPVLPKSQVQVRSSSGARPTPLRLRRTGRCIDLDLGRRVHVGWFLEFLVVVVVMVVVAPHTSPWIGSQIELDAIKNQSVIQRPLTIPS